MTGENDWNTGQKAQQTQAVRNKIRAKGQDEKNFCLVPFTTIILEPDGKVGVCRNKGTNFPIGFIQESTIEEIWNGELARKWRREFLEGKPVNCAKEVRHRHCQHCHENNKLLDYVEFSEIQTRPILKLTANFNGKCNLQCQMCDIWQKPNGLYNQINFWEPASQNIFPYLKEVDMLSGEPFIQPDTYRLISEISKVNPECQWTFTTNVHWKINEKIKDNLDKIFIKNIIMSVDSFKADTYHKIRYPGKLDFVLENIDNFVTYSDERVSKAKNKINFVLNFLVQKDNWNEIKDAYEFCASKGIEPFITFLYDPSRYSILDMEGEERIEVFEHIMNSLCPSQILRTMRVIMPILDSLAKIDRFYCLTLLDDKLKGAGLTVSNNFDFGFNF